MNIELALEIAGRFGTDNPPTLDELKEARDTIARELHALKGSQGVDLAALTSLRETYFAVDTAVNETETAAQEAASEVEGALADIPNPDAELGAQTEEPKTDEPVEILSTRDALKRLGLVKDTTEDPVVVVGDREPGIADVAYTTHIKDDVVDGATLSDLAEVFADNRNQKVGKERLGSVESKFSTERSILTAGDKAGNTALVDMYVSPEAVTAAGGCCSLAQPIYDNPFNGSTARPIRDALPTLGVQARGKVSFFPAICMPNTGADLWTCEDDADVDPDDPDTWKQCAEVECGDEDSAFVEGIYACLTVGRFQQRFAREEWEGRLKALGAYQARIAEVALFTKMQDAVSTTHTGVDTNSVIGSVIQTLSLAQAAIVQDQRLVGVQLDWFAPLWLQNAILSDSIARRLRNSGNVATGAELLAEALGNLNIRAVWSPDIDDIEAAQYDGALTAYPATASTILAPNGSYTFLDGGQFDLGTEIVGMEEARQNKLGAFAESFEGLLPRVCNAKSLNIPIDVCSNIPCS